MTKTIIVDKASMRGAASNGAMASMRQSAPKTVIRMKGMKEYFINDPWSNPMFEGYCGECGEGFVEDPRGWKNPFE